MIVELVTLGLLFAIFVVVPVYCITKVVRHLGRSDARANARNRELIELQREELANKRLDLEIRKAELELKQLTAGRE